MLFSITHPESGQAFSSLGVCVGGIFSEPPCLGGHGVIVNTEVGVHLITWGGSISGCMVWGQCSLQGSASVSGLGFGGMHILGLQHHGVCCLPPGCGAPAPVVGCPMVQGMDQIQGSVPSKNSLPKTPTVLPSRGLGAHPSKLGRMSHCSQG